MDTYRARVVGGQHHAMQEQWRAGKLEIDAPLTLEPEPENEFDPHALKVLADGKQIGYVARNQAQHINALIKNKQVTGAKVLIASPNNDKLSFVLMSVELKDVGDVEQEQPPEFRRS